MQAARRGALYLTHVGRASRAWPTIVHARMARGLGIGSDGVEFCRGCLPCRVYHLWAKRSRFRSSYALTLWVEAVYMLLFGLLGASLARFQLLVPITVVLMCFIMGMHNTVMTMLSKGVIRSTHMTGFVTDIGIELAKFLFHSLQQKRLSWHSVNQAKFKLCTGLVTKFFCCGWCFGRMGFSPSAIPFCAAAVGAVVVNRPQLGGV